MAWREEGGGGVVIKTATARAARNPTNFPRTNRVELNLLVTRACQRDRARRAGT